MANPYFRFKQFTVQQHMSSMKVTTDSCLFGAWAAEELRKEKSGQVNVLDVGTGTGLLALMLAQKNDVVADAVEIEKGAAEEAKQNIHASPWRDRIRVEQADILKYEPPSKYDVVICNPPFYEDELASPQHNKNIAHHSAELKLALLVKKIAALLLPSGSCFLLLPQKREIEIELLLEQHKLFIAKKVMVRQTPAHGAFRIMLQCSFQQSKIENTTIIIKQDNEYTAAFKSLLKDYYLYL